MSEPVEIECSMCGRVGGPEANCEICHGNQTFKQSRAFTRTEELRSGDHSDKSRYGRTGNVSPKIVQLPGSFTPNQDNN